jgi:hypothetical protein
MTSITDEAMREALEKARPYSLMILKWEPQLGEPDVVGIIWEHGRRNLALRAEGTLAIVCPVTDGSEICGIEIFSTGPDETKRIMDNAPGAKAGVLVYEVHVRCSFPGDAALPEVEGLSRCGRDLDWTSRRRCRNSAVPTGWH